ncbi:hypothetical protein HWV62_38731 [Athelia sp. TMB]|nr:hypothetical protein HWV62_38731 [Athelia sp. TMB]
MMLLNTVPQKCYTIPNIILQQYGPDKLTFDRVKEAITTKWELGASNGNSANKILAVKRKRPDQSFKQQQHQSKNEGSSNKPARSEKPPKRGKCGGKKHKEHDHDHGHAHITSAVITNLPTSQPVPLAPRITNVFPRPSARVIRKNLVDTRTMCIINDTAGIPPIYIRTFSELSGCLRPLLWPEQPRISHGQDALEIQHSNARTDSARLLEMAFLRQDIEVMLHRASEGLSINERNECRQPYITLYKRHTPTSSHITKVHVDHIFANIHMHPVYNPLVKAVETTFLHTAAYFLANKGRAQLADKIDRLLRTPHYDDWEARKLTCLGALETKFREDEAAPYFE